MVKKITYDLGALQRQIKKAMQEQKTYSKSMDMAITATATTYYSFLIARDKILKSGVMITEYSRENHKRYIISPAFYAMITSADVLRKYLRELRLTSATAEGGTENDEFTEMVKSVNAVRNATPTRLKLPKPNDRD